MELLLCSQHKRVVPLKDSFREEETEKEEESGKRKREKKKKGEEEGQEVE